MYYIPMLASFEVEIILLHRGLMNGFFIHMMEYCGTLSYPHITLISYMFSCPSFHSPHTLNFFSSSCIHATCLCRVFPCQYILIDIVKFFQAVDTVVAGILHDVVDDTNENLHSIGEEFGEDVMKLVAGVSKLSYINQVFSLLPSTGSQLFVLSASFFHSFLLSGISLL